MAKMKLPPIQDIVLDPYQGYRILSANKKYKGASFGVEFLNGKGELNGLAADADEDEVAERVEMLEWFRNGETHKLPSGHTFDPETGKVETTFEYRRPYELEPVGESNRPKPAKAEKVPVPA